MRMMADEYDAHELTMSVLTETTAQRDEAIKTVEEQNRPPIFGECKRRKSLTINGCAVSVTTFRLYSLYL